MALTLINASGYQYGVENEETGVNVESFDVSVEPEFREPLVSKTNERKGTAIAPAATKVTVKGEVSGATGLMAATFVAATTLANDVVYAGGPSSGFLMTRVNITQNRSAWKGFDAEFEAFAGQTVT